MNISHAIAPRLSSEVHDYSHCDPAERDALQLADRVEADLLSPHQRAALSALLRELGHSLEPQHKKRFTHHRDLLAERWVALVLAPTPEEA